MKLLTDKALSLFSRYFVAALFIVLAGCTSKSLVWHKPDASSDELRSALSQCQAYANREAEREYALDRNTSAGGGFSGQSTYQKNMGAYRVKSSSKDLLSRCMKLNGYRLVRPQKQ